MKVKINYFLLFVLLVEVISYLIIFLKWMTGFTLAFSQIIVFIYLTFVPGILILGILNAKDLKLAEMIVYSAGISLFFLMFVGLCVDILCPVVGVSRPFLSGYLLTSILFIFTFFLTIIVYWKNSTFRICTTNIKGVKSNSFFIFTLLPFFSIFSAYCLSYFSNNVVIIILYIIISFIPLFVIFDIISEEMYCYVLWTISISLLFSVSLSIQYPSQYLSDAALEYFYANLVLKSGIWHIKILAPQNSMLRIVILHPIYSILLNLNLIEEFRIVHPILYSFTPVAVYLAFERQFNRKISFLSTFFFISFYPFYVILSRNTRTGIAELFLALFVLTIANERLNRIGRSMFLIIFLFSIVVSHYGTSYLFFIALIMYSVIKLIVAQINNLQKCCIIKYTTTILYTIFILSWYIYTSGSSAYISLISVFRNLFINFTNFGKSYVSYALNRKWVFSIVVCRDMLIVATVFIVVGVFDAIYNCFFKRYRRYQNDFLILSIIFFIILLSCNLPTKIFNPARVYHISLCLIAPYIVVGFIKVCNFFNRIINSKKNSLNFGMKIFAIFIVIFFLFNSGVISEVVIKGNDFSPNIIVSKPRALDVDNSQFIKSFYTLYFSDQDVSSAKWLSKMRKINTKIYMDDTGVFYSVIGPPSLSTYYYAAYVSNKSEVKKGYIFLYSLNIIRKVSLVELCPPKLKSVIEVYPIFSSNRLYTNSCSSVYYHY